MAISTDKIRAFIELTRPLNNLILALSVLLAIALTGRLDASLAVTLAVISALLVASGGNVLNDCFDVITDRRNKPGRPLPSGRVTLAQAYVFAAVLLLFGCGLAWFLSPANLLIAIAAALSLIAYDYRYKNRPFIGNVIVSFLSALAFLYGGFAVNRVSETVVPAIFAFFFHLGREIVKDTEDVAGDTAQGSRTLPIVWGADKALLLAAAIYAVLIALTVAPYGLGLYGWRYLLIVAVGVDAVLIVMMISVWRDRSPEHLGRVSRWLKYDMLVGIFALYMG